MASVSSLDRDLKNLRLDKYTPQRANETRQWIERILGESLASGDLLEALKDGQALCKLVNLAIQPESIKFKQSSMPFVQMENISHFLRACQAPPLGLQPHDVFLTVDLYEGKDPAQVLQCISAFSRRANALKPDRFPSPIGVKSAVGVVTPQGTGSIGASSPSNHYIGRNSPPKPTASPGGVSSWAKKSDQGSTAPAWNIAQYGWTGGASQGNQGIAFGARRQITSTAPKVPSLAEKEKLRREEAERAEQEAADAEKKRRAQRDAEEEQGRLEEGQRWEAETAKLREEERKAAEDEKKRWEAEERSWREDAARREREEKEAEAQKARDQAKSSSTRPVLQGQYLSEYNASKSKEEDTRIKDLERQLAEAKERERQYELEREQRLAKEKERTSAQPAMLVASVAAAPEPVISHQTPHQASQPAALDHEASFTSSPERKALQEEWQNHQNEIVRESVEEPAPAIMASSQVPASTEAGEADDDPDGWNIPQYVARPTSSQRQPNSQASPPALPALTATASSIAVHPSQRSPFSRPVSTPQAQTPIQLSTTDSQSQGRPKTLLEREMDLERQRQKEWEDAQQEASTLPRDTTQGSGPGQSWDVNQYGYTGGDSQNKGAMGIYSGRRQILGPRPMVKK